MTIDDIIMYIIRIGNTLKYLTSFSVWVYGFTILALMTIGYITAVVIRRLYRNWGKLVVVLAFFTVAVVSGISLFSSVQEQLYNENRWSVIRTLVDDFEELTNHDFDFKVKSGFSIVLVLLAGWILGGFVKMTLTCIHNKILII